MKEDNTMFKIPGVPVNTTLDFAPAKTLEAPIAQAVEPSFQYFDELNKIAEELEKCRSKML